MAVELSYPKEVSPFNCRLLFKKYSRPRPGNPVTSEIEATIRLPLPTTLTDQFNMDIGDTQLDILGNSATDVLMGGKTKLESYASEIRSGKGAISFIKDASIEAAAIMPGLSDIKIGELARTQVGMIRNPHHTALFNGVKLKTYGFNWKMSPKSQEEAITLEEIIKNIKGYMHPSINANSGGFALDYPSLVELIFEVGSNQIVPNVKPSFVTSFSVNGAAGGTPAFYRDGKSSIVEMSIALQEINIQTREDFLGRISTTGQ
jgi:hypothetical protein